MLGWEKHQTRPFTRGNNLNCDGHYSSNFKKYKSMITQIWTETLANDNVVFKDTDRTSHCAPLNSINHYPVIGHGVERYQISIQPLETIENSATPLYDHLVITSHFILTREKAQSVIFLLKTPFNTTTSLIRPIFHGLKVVVLTEFLCNKTLIK